MSCLLPATPAGDLGDGLMRRRMVLSGHLHGQFPARPSENSPAWETGCHDRRANAERHWKRSGRPSLRGAHAAMSASNPLDRAVGGARPREHRGRRIHAGDARPRPALRQQPGNVAGAAAEIDDSRPARLARCVTSDRSLDAPAPRKTPDRMRDPMASGWMGAPPHFSSPADGDNPPATGCEGGAARGRFPQFSSPPWALMISRAMTRPRPVPPFRAVPANGWNSRSCTLSSIPGPSSRNFDDEVRVPKRLDPNGSGARLSRVQCQVAEYAEHLFRVRLDLETEARRPSRSRDPARRRPAGRRSLPVRTPGRPNRNTVG